MGNFDSLSELTSMEIRNMLTVYETSTTNVKKEIDNILNTEYSKGDRQGFLKMTENL
jgi:hypothetical protein